MPLNAFVDLHVLQERLGFEQVKPSRRDPIGKQARINTLLAHDSQGERMDPRKIGARLIELTRKAWTLADLNLRVIENSTFHGIVVESEQMILEDKLAEAAQATAKEMNLASSPTMVYLANKLWNPKIYDSEKRVGYSMYSTVAGLDLPDLEGTPFGGFEYTGEKPKSWGEDDVILNEFLATDLQVQVGDTIKFTYHDRFTR